MQLAAAYRPEHRCHRYVQVRRARKTGRSGRTRTGQRQTTKTTTNDVRGASDHDMILTVKIPEARCRPRAGFAFVSRASGASNGR